MATNTITTTEYTDDLDPSVTENVATVHWGFDGQWYEIDLGERNMAKLQAFLDKYAPVSREIELAAKPAKRRSGSGKPRSASGRTREQADAARAYAQANGLAVSEKGRIAGAVWEAYEASL